MLISLAHAQEAAAPIGAEPSAFAGLLPLLLIFVVFYVLLIRPQQKKYKEHLSMVTAIAKGDTIVTSGGIVGKVTKVDTTKDILHTEIADGVEVKVIRGTVSAVLDEEGKPSRKKAAPAVEKTAVAAKAADAKTTAAKKKTAAKKSTAA